MKKVLKSLYRIENEKDSCGVGIVANIKGIHLRKTVEHALQILSRMSHRGGTGYEKNSGDGAGILIGKPDKFFRSMYKNLPKEYAAGNLFFHNPLSIENNKNLVESLAKRHDINILTWRYLPTNNSFLGKVARTSEPTIIQVFAESNKPNVDFAKQLYLLSNNIEETTKKSVSVCSLSPFNIVYKGQLTSEQLGDYFLDLKSDKMESHFAMVHSRFSTNTLPSWEKAQPNKMTCHNGEINTIKGNISNFNLRKPMLQVTDLNKLSDSGNFDAVLQYMTRLSNREIYQNVNMMIPEAWENNAELPEHWRRMFKINGDFMEPWDGPALMAFQDKHYMGCTLDRNGLRPGRYYVTKDNMLYLSSELGVVDIYPSDIVQRRRIEPGKMLLVDFDKGRLLDNHEVKELISQSPEYKNKK